MYKSITLMRSLFNSLNISALDHLTYETYNAEYESYCFQINHCSYRHRLAKKNQQNLVTLLFSELKTTITTIDRLHIKKLKIS